jgi:hypothetical protein
MEGDAINEVTSKGLCQGEGGGEALVAEVPGSGLVWSQAGCRAWSDK